MLDCAGLSSRNGGRILNVCTYGSSIFMVILVI
uniref:Uncharacterized protein n=1 Tax=Arundo donax TaxID=35708 RepID=A0A0A9CED2_ARUDO